MIDINIIRNNPELVKENIKKKFQDSKLVLVDEVIELDKKIEHLRRMVTTLEPKETSFLHKLEVL